MKVNFDMQFVPCGKRTVVIRLQGHLDAHSAPHLLARCTEVHLSGRNLVLNLAGVTFIASSGVGALLALVEEFRQTFSVVRLAEVPPAVGSVIHLLNLDQFLTMDASEQEALAAAAAEAA